MVYLILDHHGLTNQHECNHRLIVIGVNFVFGVHINGRSVLDQKAWYYWFDDLSVGYLFSQIISQTLALAIALHRID